MSGQSNFTFLENMWVDFNYFLRFSYNYDGSGDLGMFVFESE